MMIRPLGEGAQAWASPATSWHVTSVPVVCSLCEQKQKHCNLMSTLHNKDDNLFEILQLNKLYGWKNISQVIFHLDSFPMRNEHHCQMCPTALHEGSISRGVQLPSLNLAFGTLQFLHIGSVSPHVTGTLEQPSHPSCCVSSSFICDLISV